VIADNISYPARHYGGLFLSGKSMLKSAHKFSMNYEISESRIRSLVREELLTFQRRMKDTPMERATEFPAMTILWLSRFFSHHFDREFVRTLRKYVQAYKNHPEYDYNYWWRFLPLENALLFHGDGYRACMTAMANLAHHNSRLRHYCTLSLAPVSRRMFFSHRFYQKKITYSLQNCHLMTDSQVLLLLNADGKISDKMELLEEWTDPSFRHDSQESITELLAGGTIHIDFFAGYFLPLMSYISTRLLAKPSHEPLQLDMSLIDDPLTQAELMLQDMEDYEMKPVPDISEIKQRELPIHDDKNTELLEYWVNLERDFCLRSEYSLKDFE
jgi:hypothetical protein